MSEQDIFVVIEETDGVIANCFTTSAVAEEWVASDRMGNAVAGPFTVSGVESVPFKVVFEVRTPPIQVQDVYLESEISDSDMSSSYSYLGAYSVYDSIDQFDSELE